MTDQPSPGTLFGRYFAALNKELHDQFKGQIKAEELRVYLEKQLRDFEELLYAELKTSSLQLSHTPLDLTLLLLTAWLKLEQEVFKANKVSSSTDLQKHRLQCLQTFVKETLKSLPAATDKTTVSES